MIPLNLANPSMYHSAAQENPTSSNNGGCSKYAVVQNLFDGLISQLRNVGNGRGSGRVFLAVFLQQRNANF